MQPMMDYLSRDWDVHCHKLAGAQGGWRVQPYTVAMGSSVKVPPSTPKREH